jgi:uncharacterized membrane protein YqhA
MITNTLERILWTSRYVLVLPVFGSLILAIAMFGVTTVDALTLIGTIWSYVQSTDSARNLLYIEIITSIVSVIDGFLLSAVLFIFSVGIYELFIGKIDFAENSEVGERLILIKSLDDLKDRLANVILLILIVKFFQQALNTKYTNVNDVFLLAVSIALIAGTLYLSGRANPRKELKIDEKSVK